MQDFSEAVAAVCVQLVMDLSFVCLDISILEEDVGITRVYAAQLAALGNDLLNA